MRKKTPEERRLTKRLWAQKHRAQHLEEQRAYQREWARKQLALNPEKTREKRRVIARASRAKGSPEQQEHRRTLQAIYERRYRLVHPEKERAKHQRYYQRHVAEILEKGRIYKASHCEERRLYHQNRRRIHGELLRAAESARWAALPPEVRQAKSRSKNQASKISVHKRRLLDPVWHAIVQEKERAKEHRRRAHLAQAPVNDLTAEQWHEIKAAYGHRCVYCGKKPLRLTMDHITPLSKGGAHTKHNVVPACRSCNSRKRAGPVLRPVQPLLI